MDLTINLYHTCQEGNPDLPQASFYFRKDCLDDKSVIKEVFEENCYRLPSSLKGKKVIDIGANIGVFTVLAMQRGARVVGFEPEPENFELLIKNMLVNDLQPELHRMGIGKPGVYEISQLAGQSSVVEGIKSAHGGHRVQVELISINNILKEPVDFLKIDCEGSELAIFEDISEESLGNIRKMVVEVHQEMTHNLAEKLALKFKVTQEGDLLFCS